jgi:hypothetical protein
MTCEEWSSPKYLIKKSGIYSSKSSLCYRALNVDRVNHTDHPYKVSLSHYMNSFLVCILTMMQASHFYYIFCRIKVTGRHQS